MEAQLFVDTDGISGFVLAVCVAAALGVSPADERRRFSTMALALTGIPTQARGTSSAWEKRGTLSSWRPNQ